MDTNLLNLSVGLLAAVVAAVLLWKRWRSTKPAGGIQTRVLTPLKILEHPSPNFNDRGGATISFLILHYTAMNTAQEALDRLSDPAAKVSAHYLVDEDGTIYRLVADDKSAWHAGVSFWSGNANLNGKSIGIEIANPGDRPFPPAQMAAVTQLCQQIVTAHGIAARHVLAHSDIAPTRKQDPGRFFDWRELASEGIGIWPVPSANDYERSRKWVQTDLRRALSAYGYNPDDDFKFVVTAFQRHFQPEVFQTPVKVGVADGQTAARLACLLRLSGG